MVRCTGQGIFSQYLAPLSLSAVFREGVYDLKGLQNWSDHGLLLRSAQCMSLF